MAVFEDDHETGYFYALDLGRGHGEKIGDAMQIYTTTEDYGDENRESKVVRILWATDGTRAGLEVDGHLQAAVDFTNRVGCCLSGFPASPDGWRRLHAQTADEVADFLNGNAV